MLVLGVHRTWMQPLEAVHDVADDDFFGMNI
jgi:hypothetical protein